MSHDGLMIILFGLPMTMFGLAYSETRGFVVTAPALFGSEEAVCVSFKNTSSPQTVLVQLLEHKSDFEIASIESTVNGISECLTIRVPHPPHLSTVARLLVKITPVGNNTSAVKAVRTISLMPEPWLTYIITNKLVYGSRDLVHIRIFSVKSNLYPLLDKFDKIWIENPQGIHVAQWLSVKPVGGFIDLTFQLVPEPFSGVWTVRVSKHGHIQSRVFYVQSHDVPSFQITLTLPKAMEGDVSAPITVCARYTFKQPVRGTVQITMTVNCAFKYYCSNETESSSVNLTLKANGCITSKVIANRVDSPVWQYLTVNATVEESGTGVRVSEAGKLNLMPPGAMSTVKGVFKLATTKIKPALPFFGKFSLLSRNKTWQQTNTEVELCYSMDNKQWCATVLVDKFEVFFVIPPQSSVFGKNAEKIILQASWRDQNAVTRRKQNYLRPWFSPSSSYVQIQSHLMTMPLACDQNVPIQVFYTSQSVSASDFYVMIKARGSIQMFEVVSVMANFVSLDSVEWQPLGVVSLGPQQSNINISGFAFNISISAAWTPSASLVVYAVTTEGEVISDSATININPCFSGKVTALWGSKEAAPGSAAKLHIAATPDSTCAINVIDRKLELFEGEASSLQTMVYRQLMNKYKQTSVPNDNHINCIKDVPRTEVKDPDHGPLIMPHAPTSNFVDSLDAFETNGLLVMSNLTVVSRPCSAPINIVPRAHSHIGSLESLEANEWDEEGEERNRISDPEPSTGFRSRFPVTWLWSLIHIDGSGKQEINTRLPDSVTEWAAHVTCLSRSTGLAVAEPAVILTFQPFFIEFSLPPVIRRYELLYLPVSIFNFMDFPLPVVVVIEPSEFLHVRSALTISLCISSRGHFVHTFTVEAVKLGPANVSIRAHVDLHTEDKCGPALQDYKIDYLTKTTEVKAEGQFVEDVHSSIICGRDREDLTGLQPNYAEWNTKMSVSDYVNQTVTSHASVSGDVFGPALMGIDNLISQPSGCGEQNMMLFASNVLLVRYLLSRYLVSEVSVSVTKALRNIEQGYQQQLNFRHSDGSYSAFGPSVDSVGSMWLSANAVRYLSGLSFVHVDKAGLNKTIAWILSQQLENGCFPILGDNHHWQVKGGDSTEPVQAVTSFVLISLLKAGVLHSDSKVKNALICIKAPHPQDLYSDLLAAYALSLSGQPREARWRMRELLKTASRSYQTLWWKDPDGATESSITLTSYGVLTLVNLGGEDFMSAAADAVRWLLQYQNRNADFPSIQDQIIALEALAEFSLALPRTDGSLHVIVDYLGGNRSFNIDDSNRQLQQTMPLPLSFTKINFTAVGSGCALVQTVIQYNVRRGSNVKTLKLQLRVDPVVTSGDGTVRRVEICVRTRFGDPPPGMAVIEVTLPTGFYADRASLYRIIASQKGVKQFEEYEDRVKFYLDQLKSQKRCFSYLMKREICVENPSPVFAKVYYTYDFRYYAFVRYTVQQSCENSWLNLGVSELESSERNRRETTNSGSFNLFAESNTLSPPSSGRSFFSQFKDVDIDLHVPTQISDNFQVYAMPPPKEGNVKCPQCQTTTPKLFLKLYCSSLVAAKIRFLGKQLMTVLENLSPYNSTLVKRDVSYTMNGRCSCHFIDTYNSLGMFLVTPPKFFSLRSIQVVHLDDSITIFPWNSAASYLQSLKQSSTTCQNILTS